MNANDSERRRKIARVIEEMQSEWIDDDSDHSQTPRFVADEEVASEVKRRAPELKRSDETWNDWMALIRSVLVEFRLGRKTGPGPIAPVELTVPLSLTVAWRPDGVSELRRRAISAELRRSERGLSTPAAGAALSLQGNGFIFEKRREQIARELQRNSYRALPGNGR
jgi:hypothetical protein